MSDVAFKDVSEMTSCLTQALTMANMLSMTRDGMDGSQINDIGDLFERLLSQPLEIATTLYVVKKQAEEAGLKIAAI